MERRRGERQRLSKAKTRLAETATSSSTLSHGIDPDPFTLVVGIVSVVAGVAQIVHLAHGLWPRDARRVAVPIGQFLELLSEELKDAIRDIEKVGRHLREVRSIYGQPVLDAPAVFGGAPMGLNDEQLLVHERLIDELSWRTKGLNKATLAVIRFDPEFAATLGADILSSLANIQDRINDLQRGTIDATISDALFMLREIERIALRINQSN